MHKPMGRQNGSPFLGHSDLGNDSIYMDPAFMSQINDASPMPSHYPNSKSNRKKMYLRRNLSNEEIHEEQNDSTQG